MANFSLRLLSIFVLTAVVVNITNYYFIKMYRPRHDLMKYGYTKATKSARGFESRRSLSPKSWSSAVVCDNCEEDSSSSSQKPNITELNKADISSNLTPSSASKSMLESTSQTTTETVIQNCPEIPPNLDINTPTNSPGPEFGRSHDTKNFIEDKIIDVLPGGIYQPQNCKSLQSVAVIIAYRGCKGYLNIFMEVLHPFLIKQQLDYQVFVVEQSNKTQPFNRGKLLNVGFAEANHHRKDGFQCIIFHDPLIIPTDTRNLYRCSWYPRQLATFVERAQKPPYAPLLGGAVAITPQQFVKFNGFSNGYWGNDADYFDLYFRMNTTNYYVENSVTHIGKYKTLRKGLPLWQQSAILSTPSSVYIMDGLTSLKYTVDKVELKRLFTYLQVNIDDATVSSTQKMTKQYDKLLSSSTLKMPSIK
ncbi:hypothetical protein HW555_000405 [Spodoptera exigua]|uniref:Beta-1,4-N-acetylgalactosaminyltransferase n=1 Tax=Spodoptera exigua TaxID=7107 RepID=A0A835GWD5_SPOEX|nr:hypothetical protein HW555_000405 [Spodoptera exigua]